MQQRVAAFYRFVLVQDPEVLRTNLLDVARQAGVLGTILVAREGINGTLSGLPNQVEQVLEWVRADPRFAGLEARDAWAKLPPFHRLKVRLKSEIVTIGCEVDPTERVGVYLDPFAWNELLDDPEVVLLDTRNDYETAIGSFEGAVDPELRSFRGFPAFVEGQERFAGKRVAMFCTGGIRCEKASSYLLAQGVHEVYHLQGGILRYLAEVPEAHSRWRGQCFVFDERVSVGHGLIPGGLGLCRGCRRPLTTEARAHPAFEEGARCGACGPVDEATLQSRRERAHQERLAQLRGSKHVGRSLSR